MHVTYVCVKSTKTLEIGMKELNTVEEDHKRFAKNFKLYQNRIFDTHKDNYALDYIVGIPDVKLPKSLRQYGKGEKLIAMLRREVTFKNLVMNVIIDIRRERKKPKLSDLLVMFRGAEKGRELEQ